MIKKYKDYIKESLLNNLQGLDEQEAWNNLLKKYNNNYDDIIFAAARANYVDGVKKSLEIINKEGNGGLNFANLILNDTIAYGSIDVLKYLIEEEGASVEGYYGQNLENAASNNQAEIIKYLLSKGADVNINKGGPLWRVISKGYVECAKELLEAGAKLEPYMVGVVDKKNKPMLELLSKYVVQESILNKLEGPSEEEIRKFINHIKDINEKLSQAIKHNFFDIVEDIVRSNNYNEELALRNSLYFDNNKITYYLLKNNKILNSGNINALNLILRQASEFGNLELVIYSIENGADVNSGRSYALRYAIMGGYIDVAKYLIKHGADVELANSFIIKYKKFDDSKILLQLANANESLLNKLDGPNEEEFIKYLDSLGNTKKIKKIITLGEEYYKYLPDNLIVDSDLDLNFLRVEKLPDNLTIKGDLDCGVCNLSFLPRNLKVGGKLYCNHNFLTELPDDLVDGVSICCSNNELTSLPDNLTVNGWLDCGFNKLTKLPENLTVNGEFWCGKNALPLKIPASAKIKGEIHD